MTSPSLTWSPIFPYHGDIFAGSLFDEKVTCVDVGHPGLVDADERVDCGKAKGRVGDIRGKGKLRQLSRRMVSQWTRLCVVFGVL
jgi:hypothetical protein